MRHFIQNTLDRVAAELAAAGPGQFDYTVRPFSSFHVSKGHHLGRILVKLLRGQQVTLENDMVKRLLWAPQLYSANKVVPAQFSEKRHEIFLESLFGQMPDDFHTTGLWGGLSSIDTIVLRPNDRKVSIDYRWPGFISCLHTRLPVDDRGRTHYHPEVDGAAPIVTAILAGDREIVVHTKSFFDHSEPGDRRVPVMSSSTIEMVLHVLLERHNNMVSYHGKSGALALKHLIRLALLMQPANRISIVPGAYLSTRVNIYNHQKSVAWGFEVDKHGVAFYEGMSFMPFRPGLAISTYRDWVTACALPAQQLELLREGSVIGEVTVGKVDLPAPEPKHATDYHRSLVVLTEDRLEVISADNGWVIFSAACQRPKGSELNEVCTL